MFAVYHPTRPPDPSSTRGQGTSLHGHHPPGLRFSCAVHMLPQPVKFDFADALLDDTPWRASLHYPSSGQQPPLSRPHVIPEPTAKTRDQIEYCRVVDVPVPFSAGLHYALAHTQVRSATLVLFSLSLSVVRLVSSLRPGLSEISCMRGIFYDYDCYMDMMAARMSASTSPGFKGAPPRPLLPLQKPPSSHRCMHTYSYLFHPTRPPDMFAVYHPTRPPDPPLPGAMVQASAATTPRVSPLLVCGAYAPPPVKFDAADVPLDDTLWRASLYQAS
ncbi:hypothetical protein L226DRAFT_574428 [Lentinus tigrinus ALCF2SS1-7]|uniref:uncharacterized protein n=1 Tax=Lentinus tigrinus ALCF2SS1-7 TaxID=1328758 RepID=UPI0011662B12|nr:hypothetical protein L226DRAFT_574428 [Lentinus tigrinus ALCF2SS1-7]